MKARLFAALVFGGFVASFGSAAWAFDPDEDPFLQPAVNTSLKLAQIARENSAKSITIGKISEPIAYRSSAGVGISRLLQQELKERGLNVVSFGGDLAVQGEATLTSEGAQLALSVQRNDGKELTVIQDNNAAVKVSAKGASASESVPTALTGGGRVAVKEASLTVPVKNPLAAAKLMGTTADLERIILANRRPITMEDIRATFQQPEAVAVAAGNVPGGYLKASRQSPFSMGILVNNQAQPLTMEQGHSFVELAGEQEYEIVLWNNSNYRAAFIVEIDGVNTFALSKLTHELNPHRPRYTRWLVNPNTSHTIRGWHVDNTQVHAFKITSDPGNFPAQELGVTGDVGTIRVTAVALWPASETKPPEQEMRLMRILQPMLARELDNPPQFAGSRNLGSSGPTFGSAGPGDGAPAHTGRGQRKEQNVEGNTIPNEYGEPRMVMTLRYRMKGQ